MPVINTTTLQQLVAIKQIGWISLDTNIFIACGKDIKKSPVNDIQKISDKVGFVLSWITKEEVIKKYVEKNIDDASQLKNSYNRLRRILDSSTCTNLDSILTLDLSCHIRNAFDSFCKNTSCQIYYPENGIDIKEIFELYFNSIPPFEDSKNKKCEFPDAAMLVCLEQFAKEYDTNILLITCDKGGVDYAMDSESIFVLEELSNNGKALLLSAINALTFDKYNLFIEKFKECAQAEHNFYDNIKSCITELVTDTSNYGINLISAYYCDAEISDVVLSDINIEDSEFSIANIEEGKIKLITELNMPITVCVSYETYIKDSIDGDFIVADRSTLDIDESVLVEIECVALIDSTETDIDFELSDINVNLTKKYIDVEIDSLYNFDDDDYDR